MALVFKDMVEETSATSGTGTLTLAGATSGHQSFSVIGNGNTCYYVIRGSTFAEWETGIGTYTSSGTTFARTLVLDSSNSGSAVNFTAGGVTVRCVAPAAAFRRSFVLARDVKAANTDGGTATSGSWGTRTLTEITSDPDSIASLSSNAVTLPAGTYRFRAASRFYRTAQTQIRLYNQTDSSVIQYGLNAYCIVTAGDGSGDTATVEGQFTITASKAIRVEYRVAQTQNTNGLGTKMNVSGDEVYTSVSFERVIPG